jgi:acetoin utilization deacetylase AcuC-like enzyme
VTMKTSNFNIGIIYHEDCEGHAIQDVPERPDRVSSILTALRNQCADFAFIECDMASDMIMKLYHTDDHVDSFMEMCRKSEATTMKMSIDQDTQVMRYTRIAVCRAVGAAIMAIDRMFLPITNPLHISSAFCCVRPPGHHAERNKKMGFCFMNNAAIAAKYAQQVYGVDKIAVLVCLSVI